MAGVKPGCVHLRRVAGNTVWSHMASHTPYIAVSWIYPLTAYSTFTLYLYSIILERWLNTWRSTYVAGVFRLDEFDNVRQRVGRTEENDPLNKSDRNEGNEMTRRTVHVRYVTVTEWTAVNDERCRQIQRQNLQKIMVTFIRQWLKADNTVTRNRKNRRQTDVLQLLLRKDNPTEIITNSSKHRTRGT